MVSTPALISRVGLNAQAGQVAEEVSNWQDVEAVSRPENSLDAQGPALDGMTFRLGTRELGHIHGDSEAHITLRRGAFEAVVALGLARASPWSKHQAIVSIQSLLEAQRALFLFKLSAQGREALTAEDLKAAENLR